MGALEAEAGDGGWMAPINGVCTPNCQVIEQVMCNTVLHQPSQPMRDSRHYSASTSQIVDVEVSSMLRKINSLRDRNATQDYLFKWR